ncbi:MAG: hypothetical protein ACM31E_00220 [Fibrobacterota bacterium]
MFKKTLVTLVVGSSMLLLSCDDNPSGSTGSNNNPETKNDLQKIANAVDNLGMLDNSNKQDRSLQKAKAEIEEYTCSPLGTGIEVCNYTYGDEQGIDTTYSYAMDGVTLKDYEDLGDSYKQLIKSHYASSKYKGVSIITITTEIGSSSDETVFEDFKMSVSGTATIDYFNDDLILNFSKVSCVIDNNSSSYDYRFTMFDGKYSVSMNGTLIEASMEEPADTDVIASGPITLVSTGETVGTFKLLYSCDVQILDGDGNIIKKTN